MASYSALITSPVMIIVGGQIFKENVFSSEREFKKALRDITWYELSLLSKMVNCGKMQYWGITLSFRHSL